MAEALSCFETEDLVNKLQLTKYYPEKLTRDDLYQITAENINSNRSDNCSPAWQFIYDITRYNYHARNIQSNEKEATPSHKMGIRERCRRQNEASYTQLHPLDILVAVFLCCDHTAKQDLVMHLWGCKLALPLSVNSLTDKRLFVYLWPLRSLIGQFQTHKGFVENQMICESTGCIAFVRAGENKQYSKSHLLNCLIWGAEKPHPTFFHRNSDGSKKNRSSVTNGLIEIAWYLPSETKEGRLKGPCLFVNLRGDAINLPLQTKLIGLLATITFILTTMEKLTSTVPIIHSLLRGDSRVIIVVTDPDPDIECIASFLDTNFANVSETKLDAVTSEQMMMSDFLDTLHRSIAKFENKYDKTVTLADFFENMSDRDFYIDERSKDFTDAFQFSNAILKAVKEVNEHTRKETLLPLQCHFWKLWSQLDRERSKTKYENKHTLQRQLKDLRNSQYQYIIKKGVSPVVSIFIRVLSTSESCVRKIFLRMLKLELDKLSRIYLRPVYDQYQELVTQTVNVCKEERISINKRLSDLDEQKSQLSFGLEHILREIGQIYEAFENQNNRESVISGEFISYKTLPTIACLILLDGYPVEILDGEACSVPILWIKKILSNVPRVATMNGILQKPENEIKVHTISVLGIQSSGKSTFLNTVFGLQFAVSAGRCTRGAFMQLIKVQPSFQQKVKADFLMAIDTEGLKAVELVSTESVKHDNELSTFVIGLADTTVVNLMGENASYLQENLPIAVHAFIRMKLAGLRPRCTIVHHNVDKRNKEKLLQQGRILESILNKLTAKVCEMERVPQRMFNEMIEFSIANHTDYIPALYEGEQPMAPINVGYSTECDLVRTKLLKHVQLDDEIMEFSTFARHLENLWNAIKKDQFVFEFRTALETEARQELDKGFSKILLSFMQQVDTIVIPLRDMIIYEKTPLKKVDKVFITSFDKVEKKTREELKSFIDGTRKTTLPSYDEWTSQYVENLDFEMQQTLIETMKDFEHFAQKFQAIPMDKMESFIKLVMCQSSIDFDSNFTLAWDKWSKMTNLQSEDTRVLTHTIDALKDVCKCHTYLLEGNIEMSSFDNFQPSKSDHLNSLFHTFSEQRTDELCLKLSTIIEFIHLEYRKELLKIKKKGIPYSHRIPKQILLTLENVLTEKLKNEDKSNEISNTFNIQILCCAAGSLMKDLYEYVKKNSFQEKLKSELKIVALRRVRESNDTSNILYGIIFEILDLILESQFEATSERCLIDSLALFGGLRILNNKQSLLGFCLKIAIKNDRDDLLYEYFNNTEMAIYDILVTMLKTMTEEEEFKCSIEKSVKLLCNIVCDPLNSMEESDTNFETVLDNLLKNCRKITTETKKILKEKYICFRGRAVNLLYLQSLKKTVKKRMEKYYLEKSNDFINRTSNTRCIEDFATTLLGSITGCTEVCPFCKEMCKYSRNHPGDHECFSHRPIGCVGWHKSGTNQLAYEPCHVHFENNSIMEFNSKKILFFRDYKKTFKNWNIESLQQEWHSCIWKWIFVNKYSVLQKTGYLQLPKDLPKEWREIGKGEAIWALKDLCRL